MSKVTSQLSGKAHQTSYYRRAQRFFSELSVNQEAFIRLMIALNKQDSYRLVIDRTNWQFGCVNINILMLAMVNRHGIAIPLAFELLDKRGNSNTPERMCLLKRVLDVIPPEKVEVFLSDREFIGSKWFTYLNEHKIPFVIRMRQNVKADEWFRLNGFFQNLPAGEHKVLKHRYCICGVSLAVAATRSSDGQLVIVVTNRNPAKALRRYLERWQIESLFRALKSSGFQIEDTHLRNIQRLSTLVAVVCLTFSWALLVGQWRHRVKPIKVKSHGRREVSVFRYGLDFLSHALTNYYRKPSLLHSAVGLLSCT